MSGAALNTTLMALTGRYLQAGIGSCALENRLFYQPKGWETPLGDWNCSWVLTPDGERANEEEGDGSFIERVSHLPVEECEEQCDSFRSQGYPCEAVYTLDADEAAGGVTEPSCMYLSEKCVQNGQVPCLADDWCGRNAPHEPDPMLCLFFGRTCQWYNPMTFLSGAFFFMWNSGVSRLAVAPLALLLYTRGRCSSAECKASVCALMVPHWYVGILVPLYVGGLLAFLLAVPLPYARAFRAHQEQMKRQDEAESAAADAAAALDLRERVAGAYGVTASPDGYPRAGGPGVAHGVAIDHEALEADGEGGEGGERGDVGDSDGEGEGEVPAAMRRALSSAAVAVGLPMGTADLAVVEGVVADPGSNGDGAVRHPEGVVVVVGENVTYTRDAAASSGIVIGTEAV